MACHRESGFKDTKFWWIVGGIFSFLFKAQQPCHASVGLCDGGHLWLRHFSFLFLDEK